MPAACTSTCRPCCRRPARPRPATTGREPAMAARAPAARAADRPVAPPSSLIAGQLSHGVEQTIDLFHRRVAGTADANDAIGSLADPLDHRHRVEIPI